MRIAVISGAATVVMLAMSANAQTPPNGPAPTPSQVGIDLSKGPPAPLPPVLQADSSLLPKTAQKRGHQNVRPMHHKMPKPPSPTPAPPATN